VKTSRREQIERTPFGDTMADQLSTEPRTSTTARRPHARTVRDLFVSPPSECQWSKWTLRDAVRHRLSESSILPADESRDGRPESAWLPEGDSDPATYYSLLADRVLPYAANVGSPRCMAHMTALAPAFVHELTHVLLALNQNLVKRDASNGFTTLERETLAMMHRLTFDLPAGFYEEHEQDSDKTLGIFCSGGTLANLTALWIARNHGLHAGPAGVESLGVPASLAAARRKNAVVVGSRLMHYSVRKAAGLLGVGEENVRLIPVDERGRVLPASCRDMLRQCANSGEAVIALVGIAGTTDYGSIDPLDELADLAAEFGVHYHVDAAWGGALLFSRAHRRRLRGLERAHSVTIDAHKQMYLPIGTSLLLLRDPQSARAIQKSSDYILQDGSRDLGRHSVEGSRPGSSLFVHAALHIIGRHGYETLVNDSLKRAAFMARQILACRDFELLAEPETNIVLYRYVPSDLSSHRSSGGLNTTPQAPLNTFNTELQQEQWRASRSAVSRTSLRHPQYADPIVALRAVVANPLATEADVIAVLDDQAFIARKLRSTPA